MDAGFYNMHPSSDFCFAFDILFRNMQIKWERKQNASRKSLKMKLWWGGKSFKSQVYKGDPGLTPPK